MPLARDSKKKNLFVSSVNLIESDRIQSVQKQSIMRNAFYRFFKAAFLNFGPFYRCGKLLKVNWCQGPIVIGSQTSSQSLFMCFGGVEKIGD